MMYNKTIRIVLGIVIFVIVTCTIVISIYNKNNTNINSSSNNSNNNNIEEDNDEYIDIDMIEDSYVDEEIIDNNKNTKPDIDNKENAQTESKTPTETKQEEQKIEQTKPDIDNKENVQTESKTPTEPKQEEQKIEQTKQNENNIIPKINVVNKVNIKLGESTTIKATSNTSNSFTYLSSDTKIATVSSAGVVTPKRTGEVIIITKNKDTEAKTTVNITGYRIHFIKTLKAGDSILLESNGEFGLVDTGDNYEFREDNTLRNYLNKYNIKSLKFIILSHLHIDHSGGLIVWGKEGNELKNMVDKVYYKSQYFETDSKYSDYSNFIKNYFCGSKNISECSKLIAVDKKEENGKKFNITLGNDMVINFYNTIPRSSSDNVTTYNYYNSVVPSNGRKYNDNINSIVNYVTVNNHSALLTGDMMYKETMNYILNNIINQGENKLDIFKIPHHGLLNCTDQGTNVTKPDTNKRLFVNSKYYLATALVDEKYNGESYGGLNGLYRNFVEQPNKEETTIYGCYQFLMKYGTTARVGLCNTYFSRNANASDGAIIIDFTNSNSTLVGGGRGKDVSSRCN